MPMTTEMRIEKLNACVSGTESCGSKMMMYKSQKSNSMNAYMIPIECLIFNKYNGRIGTSVKTHEKQYGEIDATTQEGEDLIIKFLWKSKESRNKETLQNIKEKGQLETGVVTKDGVIIDGNRRCMLLRKAGEKYFRAVVLDDTLESNPKEIRELETTYQMGVDEKVDYNAIEKYLKCKDLHKVDEFTHEQIAKMMGEKPSEIQKYLKILELMEEYLKRYGYEGMYTKLNQETVEGPFVDLHDYLTKQGSGKGIHKRDWNPKPDDIDDLKIIVFDYIRVGHRTAHGIRDIGNPAKGQGFFSKKDIWEPFRDQHFGITESVNNQEETLDDLRAKYSPETDVEKIVSARDSDWRDRVEDKLKENYGRTRRIRDDVNEADSPMELLQRAKNTINSINTNSDAFNENLIDEIKEINRKLWDFQQLIKKKSK